MLISRHLLLAVLVIQLIVFVNLFSLVTGSFSRTEKNQNVINKNIELLLSDEVSDEEKYKIRLQIAEVNGMRSELSRKLEYWILVGIITALAGLVLGTGYKRHFS